MARLARLALPDRAHWVIQRGLPGVPVFHGDADRRLYLDALREASASQQVQVHAWALLPDEVQLLLTPPSAAALSRMLQALGRRYVGAHNRCHDRRGTLWDGRFRCAVVEGGATLLAVLQLIDGAGDAGDASPLLTSAGHRLGHRRDPLVVDPPEVWQLGNTPFDREAAWARRLAHGVPPAQAAQLRQAALGGWAIGSAAFRAEIEDAAHRPAAPRPRGRPRRSAMTT